MTEIIETTYLNLFPTPQQFNVVSCCFPHDTKSLRSYLL